MATAPPVAYPSRAKRPRTPPSHKGSGADLPTPKAMRTLPAHRVAPTHGADATTAAAPRAPVLCTLPPTCHPPVHRPTPLANAHELERHYATYHAHVCQVHACGCVFPEARFLELHQTECHDPIAAVRKDRGQKIFACHLSTCARLFLTPKGRRLHLIQAHGYPKEYFFAVTNKGVGGLLKRWGEGVSMVRGSWKPRQSKEGAADRESIDGADGVADDAEEDDMPLVVEQEEDDDGHAEHEDQAVKKDSSLDQITDAMGSLALIPPAIRFGRGAKRGGYAHTTPRSHSRSTGEARMELDSETGGRGHHGGRGRGRGRGDEQHHEARYGNGHVPVRGLGGGRRSGFPRGGRVIGRLMAARGMVGGRGRA